ncbi:peptidylprolyl isomerase [Patescibacteria group bacterium]|nr:peptidylprolyl isomerase [Patescibacteria group bacterium]
MKKLIYLALSTIILSACTLPFSSNNSTSSTTPSSTSNPALSPIITSTPSSKVSQTDNNPVVSLKTKDGQILLRLFKDTTPNTARTFINKANNGFYNGLTFHRVISGFMAQGGDPTGTGQGGGTEKSELNSIPFKRGSIGLARTPDTKEYSNDSQFFICFTTEGCQQLTGDYVNFGEVISGFDVLDKIKQGDKIIEITSRTK